MKKNGIVHLRLFLSSILASAATVALLAGASSAATSIAKEAASQPAASAAPAAAQAPAAPTTQAPAAKPVLQPQTEVDYKVTPEMANGQLQDLAVEMRFQADASGRTRVDLPDSWSGAQGLSDALHDISVEGAAMTRTRPAQLVLTSAPHAPVVVRYRLIQDFKGAPTVGRESPFRPSTQPNWFTAVGWTILGEVEGRHGQLNTFHWGPTPAGWTLASDLDNGRPRKTEEMFDSVLVGGSDINLIERPGPGGGRLRIAIHGKWEFDPKRVSDLVEKIETASAGFWHEKGEDFFVAMTPLDTAGQTVQYGVGLGDAFSLWATRNQDEGSLRHILAHEHQHTWLPTRIGGVRMGPDEPLDYWLSEGFTDFYTLRVLLRSGVYSLEDFVQDYNRILHSYSSSPARDAPDRVIAQRFWQDRAVADLPYQRGLLLAALWDQRMERASGGKLNLDSVVLQMMADTDAHRPWTRHGAPANLLSVYKTLGGGDLNADVTRYVDNGAHVLLPADMFGDCATVVTTGTPIYARGFDLSKTGNLVASVDPNGPAFAAGLRDGMRIIRRESGRTGDPGVRLSYRVEDHGVQKVIAYLPATRQASEQQIVLAKNLTPAQRAVCTRVLSGETAPASMTAAPAVHAEATAARIGG